MSQMSITDASGEGTVDPHDDFQQWLKSKKAPQGLITKMTQFGMDMEMLEEIDVNDKQELKNLANDMNLSSAERLKFRVILKSISRESLNSVVYPEERKAILEMETKLKNMQQSMTNINDAKQNIENEVAKCTKLITTTYGDIVNKVIARKESLLAQLTAIANEKFTNLQKTYEEMKANSVIASSHIGSCYSTIKQKIDLNTIDQRKQNILKVAETVTKMDIVDKDNPLIKNCNIDFGCNSEQVVDIINKSGHFVSIPVPILVLVQSVYGRLKLKWKLDNVDAEKRKQVNKLKVEWSDAEIKNQEDENFDDLKVDWNFNKIIEINNIDNDNNETEIGEFKSGDYLFRFQCMINDELSKYSNIKSVSIEKVAVQARFVWTHKFPNGAQFSENDTRIKSLDTGTWVCVSSSTGWNSGKYFWKVKLNGRHSNAFDGVGVTTDYAGVSENKRLNDIGISALYHAYAGEKGIYNNKKKVKEVDRWKPGDIITINLDCDAWKIKFDLNDNDLGIFDLVPNQTYYPAVQMAGRPGYDVKLLQ